MGEVRKKSKTEVNLLWQKIKDEEEKFLEARQQRLLSSVEMAEKVKKKKRKMKQKNANSKKIVERENEGKAIDKTE